MKKVFAVLTALLPAVYLVSIGLSAVYGAEDKALFTILGLLLVIGFLLPVWFAFLAANADKKFLAVCNLWFYGGNLFLFATEIALWIHSYIENRIAAQNGAMEGGLVLFLLATTRNLPLQAAQNTTLPHTASAVCNQNVLCSLTKRNDCGIF